MASNSADIGECRDVSFVAVVIVIFTHLEGDKLSAIFGLPTLGQRKKLREKNATGLACTVSEW